METLHLIIVKTSLSCSMMPSGEPAKRLIMDYWEVFEFIAGQLTDLTRQRVKGGGNILKWRIHWMKNLRRMTLECGDRRLFSISSPHPLLHWIVRIKTASLEITRSGSGPGRWRDWAALRVCLLVPNSYYQYLNFKPHELIAKINLSLQRIFIQVLGRV